MQKKLTITMLVALISVLLSHGGIVYAQQADNHNWILGGATPGHTTFQVAVAYSKILEKVPGFTAVVENSGGGYDGIDLTMVKDLDGAATGLIGALAKYEGTGRYKGKADKNIRIFMPMYTAPVQIIVLEDSSIKSVYDLKGKRVGTMPVGAAGHSVIMNIFKAAGIKETEFESHEIEIVEMIDGLKNGNLDAVMIDTGVPTSAVMELRATHNMRFISIEKELAAKAADLNKSTFVGEISGGTYSKQNNAVATIATYAVMCTRADLPENVVYRAVKEIWNNQETLKASHASQKAFSEKWFIDVGKAVPLHDGVLKFMAEMGWK